MERIVSDDNHFHNGQTVVTDSWLNAVQDELCNFIESQGIQINVVGSDDYKQLIAAIDKKTKDYATNSAIASVYTSKTDFNSAIKLQPDGITNLLTWLQAKVETITGKKFPN